MNHWMPKIGHTHHNVETQYKMKRSLNPFNDKKWIHKNGEDEFETYSFGHKQLKGELFNIFMKLFYLISEMKFENLMYQLAEEGGEF